MTLTDFNSLFLLSQSERLQNWCQPRAAGNGCDQHHGLLCVSLPCHWQLWEVCVCARERVRESSVVQYLQCHVFSSHPGQQWTPRLVFALQLEGSSPVSPDILSLFLFCPLVAIHTSLPPRFLFSLSLLVELLSWRSEVEWEKEMSLADMTRRETTFILNRGSPACGHQQLTDTKK